MDARARARATARVVIRVCVCVLGSGCVVVCLCVCARAGDGEENKKNMNNETRGYIVLSSLRNKREGSRFTMVFVQLVNIVRYSFTDNDLIKFLAVRITPTTRCRS